MNQAIAEIQACRDSGLSITETAIELNISRAAIHRRVGRIDGKFANGSISHRLKANNYRIAVQDMKPIEAVEFLLGVIENYDSSQQIDTLAKVVQVGFTTNEAAIILRLSDSKGHLVTRDALYDAIYSTQHRSTDEMPVPTIIAVYISKIRAKIRSGLIPGLVPGMLITSVHGIGYQLDMSKESAFPWESQ